MKRTMDAKDHDSESQSGWTLYLEQSYEPPTSSTPFHQKTQHKEIEQQEEDNGEEEEEEEEDLSMVSDASSGPPHFNDIEEDEDQHLSFCSASLSKIINYVGKKRRVEGREKQRITKQEEEEEERHHAHSNPLLDDTASSPLFNLSKKQEESCVEDVLELSCGFSATKFKGKPALSKQLGYFKTSVMSKDEGEKKLW